jgi:hypothetical protein
LSEIAESRPREERKRMRKLLITCAAVLISLPAAVLPAQAISSRAVAPASTGAAQRSRRITVPAGTRILVRTLDNLDSKTQKSGTKFTAELETDLIANGAVVVKRGAQLYGQLVVAKSAGRFKGKSQLTLELTDIVIRGTAYPIITSTFEVKGEGEGKKTSRKVLGGTGLGAIIGGIAGGGAGAAIGAVSGAAAGTAVAGSKKGEQLFIPAESLLEFRLEQPASLPAPR